MEYNPGLHILSEIYTTEISLLKDFADSKKFFNQKVEEFRLCPIGEVFHNFPDGGFTGIICLTESHLALHTWPEFGMLTFDIYLSNFKRINDETVRNIFRDTTIFFKSTNYTCNELKR